MPHLDERVTGNYTPKGMKYSSHKTINHKFSHTGEGTASGISNDQAVSQQNKRGRHISESGPLGS